MTTRAVTPHDDVPSFVIIGPHTYTVDVSETRCADADVRYGQTDEPTASIILNPRQCGSIMRDTVLHEVIHAICEMQGVKHGGDAALLDHDSEERFIRGFTPLILDVLRRNPDLVSYLTS